MRLSGGYVTRYTDTKRICPFGENARVSVTMPGCDRGSENVRGKFVRRPKRHGTAQISTCRDIGACLPRSGTNRFSREMMVRTQFVRAGYVPAGLFHLSVVPADRINGAAAADQSGWNRKTRVLQKKKNQKKTACTQFVTTSCATGFASLIYSFKTHGVPVCVSGVGKKQTLR